jgi:hypothetical protein
LILKETMVIESWRISIEHALMRSGMCNGAAAFRE